MPAGYRIVVEIPASAAPDVRDAIFTAVADAAHDAEPQHRDGWDIDVYSDTLD